jgi:hypothetical protein
MESGEVWKLLADYYRDKPDDFPLSIGHRVVPFPDKPIGVFNVPEIQGVMMLTVGWVRQLATNGKYDAAQ